MNRRRVVITGTGAVTAFGEGSGVLWEALEGQKSAVHPIDFGPDRQEGSFRPVGAVYNGFEPEKFVSQRKALKVMARDIQFAVAGASLALKDSGVDLSAVDRSRFGVIAGSGILNHELDELAPSIEVSMGPEGRLDLKKFGQDGLPALFPLWLLKYLPNMPACHISILFNLEGINNTLTMGASSGLQALGEAFRIIGRGSADLMLAGGAESKTNPVGLSRYELLGFLGKARGESAETLYRPFDKKATGFAAGEASAFVVLEEFEHARKRGAKIYAEILGHGTSACDGQAIAMRSALSEAGIKPSELSYVQGCGAGVFAEDEKELSALCQVWGSDRSALTLSVSKASTGFTGFASGVLEVIVAMLSLKNKKALPVLNYSSPSKDWGIRIVKDKPAPLRSSAAMINAFGLGGPAVSAVIRASENY